MLPAAREPVVAFVITLIVIFVFLYLSESSVSMLERRGYFVCFSGGTSMIQGQMLPMPLACEPLVTTLMLSFMS